MRIFPDDFPIPKDQGGPGKDQLVGGFGGDQHKNKYQHREKVKMKGMAPVILIHGHAGSANIPGDQWDMVDLKRMLMNAGYPQELVWAPSYLSTSQNLFERFDLDFPHTNNINELREFIENVCEYLNVDVVDIIAHSLGCTMAYSFFRGLIADPANHQVDWSDELKRWRRVGTFVALAGAFHGLDPFQDGAEWKPGSEFNREILMEDETPHGAGKEKTPPPSPHNITYFCAIARGDFVDKKKRDTGKLGGAVNEVYNLGDSLAGHEEIKENQNVFDDFFPYLNSVPPFPRPNITVDRDSGNYDCPLAVTVNIEPSDKTVDYVARKITKTLLSGIINVNFNPDEELKGTINNGEELELPVDGMWEVVFCAESADDVKRTYWVGMPMIDVEILTDNTTFFEGSLNVIATTTRGTLYYSFNGEMWSLGANVTITKDTVVYFVALDSDGTASEVVSKPFKRRYWDDAATANVIEHLIAQRISGDEYYTYFKQFEFSPFTLYLINEEWMLDPCKPVEDTQPPVAECSHDSGAYTEPVIITLSAHDEADPSPKIFYTVNGSRPTTSSPFFMGSGKIKFDTSGIKILKYFARDSCGNSCDLETKTYEMDIKDVQTVIKAEPQPGDYGEALSVTIAAVDDIDEHITVYYTLDGSMPDENSSRFEDRKAFEVSGNGNHAITCYAKDSAGNEAINTFCYSIDDQSYPETGIAPSRGGTYADAVNITLTPSENVEWTKYTTSGVVLDDENGILYTEPFTVDETITLEWRSKDQQGNLEPVNKAVFTITKELEEAVFDNDKTKDGYIKANPDGSARSIGTFHNLPIGIGWDGRVSKAILHFDTAAIPDNARIKKAYLQVKHFTGCNDPWADGSELIVDIQKGFFGSSLSLQIDDWDSLATAEAVARIDEFGHGTKNSSNFNSEGLEAINKTGMTQMRLRFEPNPGGANNYIFIKQGAEVKLFVEY